MPGERRLVRVKLGRYPEVDLATARDRVRTTRLTPASAGDPAPVVLFKDLASEYIERHCKKKKKSWKQDVYWIDAELRPHWNDRPVGTIKRRDVAQLLNRIADPPRHAPASSDHVRAVVSRLFRFGISQGIDAIEYNPAHGIERANGTRCWSRTRSSGCGASGRMSSPPRGDPSSGSSSNCAC